MRNAPEASGGRQRAAAVAAGKGAAPSCCLHAACAGSQLLPNTHPRFQQPQSTMEGVWKGG